MGADGAVHEPEGGLEGFQGGGFHHGAGPGKHDGDGIPGMALGSRKLMVAATRKATR